MAVSDSAPLSSDDDGVPRRREPGPHSKSNVRWRGSIEWLGPPLAFVVDIAAALYLTIRHWFAAAVIAGALIGLSGAFWLWRLRDDARRDRTRNQLMVLTMVMIAAGSGIIAGTSVYEWRAGGRIAAPLRIAPSAGTSTTPGGDPLRSPSAGPSADPGSPPVAPPGQVAAAPPASGGAATPPVPRSGATPATGSSPFRNRTFAGDIRFQVPGFGNTLSTGQTVSGTVSAWSAGFQVWLFVRQDASSTEIPQGPCRVEGERWACADVQLPGKAGTKEYLDVVVAADSDAAGYATMTTLPAWSAHDETQAYKG